ncbi:MAG TPA: P-type conjugative transfer protein TrbG [Chlorobaculum parvum]|uniref:P-type conjugative transfer protein TrbG n=1 Tax=Chlorobaculum parvum TaxID=274539 RepID=A0A7C5HHW7_9CHLB|nr:P-type conjugative transfer protein TrbG [Chlorobaculum parvum]
MKPPSTVLASALMLSLLPSISLARSNAKPWTVIEQANQESAINPDRFGYQNAIMRYDFEDGQLYQVYGAPLKLTDIQLEPGEKLLGDPVSGDTVRWIIGRSKSMVNGLEQEHIYLKPTRPGLHTTLSLNTNLRTYHIELSSYEHTYMAAVSWNYEQYNMRQLKAVENASTESHVNLSALDFNYKIDVRKGRRPIWMPVKVFDDGRKTFIQFPEEMLVREAPVLFVIGDKGNVQLVNYRVKNDYYIVDRLFSEAELRAGEKGNVVVRIRKK